MSEQIPSTELSGYYAWTHTLQGVYYGPGSVSTALPTLLDTLGGLPRPLSLPETVFIQRYV
jgi:hypothetical protein